MGPHSVPLMCQDVLRSASIGGKEEEEESKLVNMDVINTFKKCFEDAS